MYKSILCADGAIYTTGQQSQEVDFNHVNIWVSVCKCVSVPNLAFYTHIRYTRRIVSNVNVFNRSNGIALYSCNVLWTWTRELRMWMWTHTCWKWHKEIDNFTADYFMYIHSYVYMWEFNVHLHTLINAGANRVSWVVSIHCTGVGGAVRWCAGEFVWPPPHIRI